MTVETLTAEAEWFPDEGAEDAYSTREILRGGPDHQEARRRARGRDFGTVHFGDDLLWDARSQYRADYTPDFRHRIARIRTEMANKSFVRSARSLGFDPESYESLCVEAPRNEAEATYLGVSDLSDQEVIALLADFAERFNDRVAEVESHVEEWTEEFIKAADELIDRGRLPLTKEELRERLQDFEITYYDDWKEAEKDAVGQRAYDSNIVRLSVERALEEIRETYFHELTHVIAGVTVVRNDRTGTVFETRSGLEMLYIPGLYLGPAQPEMRYRWLNEATTVEVANELLGITDPRRGGYRDERGIKTLLGLDEMLLRRAYFEDNDPVSGRPAWLELQTHVDYRHGPGFLRDLDNLIGPYDGPRPPEGGLERARDVLLKRHAAFDRQERAAMRREFAGALLGLVRPQRRRRR